MTDLAVAGSRGPLRGRPDAEPQPAVARPDARRMLQLGLAALWLLDGVLQYQPFMYTTGFARMLGTGAAGNPGLIARPITWDATLVAQHLAPLNTVFATVQLLLGLGIAFRPTVRAALAASVAWSVAVWWLGEGLGGVLTGDANPLMEAPGAVIIYALVAVLVWPADRPGAPAPFVAARAVGVRAARVLWLVFWLGQTYFALLPGSRAPQATSGLITDMEPGEPPWLAGLLRGAASLTAHQGLTVSVVFAAVFTLIGLGVYLPRPAARATLVLALVVAAALWVFVQALGGILASGATDPNSGPLLALLAVTYWPARRAPVRHPAPAALVAPGAGADPTPGAEGNLAR